MAHADDEIELAAGIPPSVPSEGDRDGVGAKQNPATFSRQRLSQCALFRGLAADECERPIGRARVDLIFLSCAFAFVGAVLIGLF